MAIRKRRTQGHIEERPNGSFRVIVYAGRDPLTGKDRRLRKTCTTYTDAQVELVRLQREVHAQRHPRSDITSAKHSCSGWTSPIIRQRHESGTTTSSAST